jgi:hypothetical protein
MNQPTSDMPPQGKRWNVYFIEFSLIFLAVTLGFLAESIREKMGDEEKELEFIHSMIEDARMDSLHISACLEANQIRVNALDTLSRLLTEPQLQQTPDSEIYRLFTFGIYHPDFITPVERTMTQLKFAGGMRLLRKKPAAEAIVQYDDMAKNLIDQQAFYELYQNGAIEQSVKLFNYNDFVFNAAKKGEGISKNVRLLHHEPLTLIEFGNRVKLYMGIVRFYNVRLQEMQRQSSILIKTLKGEYEVK